MKFSAARRHQVAVLVLEGALPMDVGIPPPVFADRPGLPYQLTACGVTQGRIAVGSGIDIVAPAGLGTLADADTVIVPGYTPPTRTLPAAVLQALIDAHDRGARIVSICYGAFALAAACLLHGRRASTHWDAADELARRYPDITVDPNVLFVDEGTVLTPAGVAAGPDLCLYIVRKDLGGRAANEIARRLVAPPRRVGDQAQYVPSTVAQTTEDRSLDEVRAWAGRHLRERLTVGHLAAPANLSTRTFERRFMHETQTTPHRWLLRERLAAARTLLEDTDLTTDDIAAHVGFGTSATMRLHFRQSMQTSPAEHRKAFTTRLHQA